MDMKSVRAIIGMSQTELSKATALNQATISQIETSRIIPNDKERAEIETALGFSIDWEQPPKRVYCCQDISIAASVFNMLKNIDKERAIEWAGGYSNVDSLFDGLILISEEIWRKICGGFNA